MARPQKNTVDYFPHMVDHGKTIFVLESQHGNDGYAFWFKLLEELGRHENHFLDLRDEAELEYFASRARTSASEASERLELLARIGAIDAGLWARRIVWSDRFVANIADAYRKRKSGAPCRPIISEEGEVLQRDTENPQIKPEQSTAEKTKPNQTSSGAAGEDYKKFATLLRTQFEALHHRAFGHEYTGLPSDKQAIEDAWEVLQDKPDRVAWLADCLSELFARSAEQRPRSIAYCSRKLVEDYEANNRAKSVETELEKHSRLVRKLGEFITDPRIIRRLFQKHGAAKLQQTYDSLCTGRHAYSYDVFREKFFERLRT